jgi:uncharacterized membrane protein
MSPQSNTHTHVELLADHVAKNIETISELHAKLESSVARQQRVIESVTRNLGRPATLYLILTFAVLWIAANVVGKLIGFAPFDPPPFYALQGTCSLSALIISTLVLITQNRLARLAQHREHLGFQVNLLTEQKATKIIALLEELRRDLPNVKNRLDAIAESMSLSADPQAVSEELVRGAAANDATATNRSG